MSMGPDEMQLHVLRELMDKVVKAESILLEGHGRTMKIPLTGKGEAQF